MIKECDNIRGATLMDCSYKKSIGISTSKSLTVGTSRQADFYSSIYGGSTSSQSKHKSHSSGSNWNIGGSAGVNFGPVANIGIQGGYGENTQLTSAVSSELSRNFGSNLGQSSSTGYNWGSSNSDSWNDETEYQVAFQVAPGVRTKLEQIVGTCGFMEVRTNQVRRTDFDKDGHPFTSSLSFTSTEAPPSSSNAEQDALFQQFLAWLSMKNGNGYQEK